MGLLLNRREKEREKTMDEDLIGIFASLFILVCLILGVLKVLGGDSSSSSPCSLQTASVGTLWKETADDSTSYFATLQREGKTLYGVKLGDDSKTASLFFSLLETKGPLPVQIEVCGDQVGKLSYQGITVDGDNNLKDVNS